MSDHQPIEEEQRATMNALAAALDEIFNGTKKGQEREWGFAMLVFRFGEEGRCNYISNAQRPEMLTAMKEFIARAEGRLVEHEEQQ